MTLPERELPPVPTASDGRPRHRGLIIFIAVLLLAGAAYGGWWYTLAEQAKRQFEYWVADVRSAGHQFTYDDVILSGFPSQVVLDLRNIKFSHASGDWHADIPHAKAHGVPWQLDRIEGSVSVPVTITRSTGAAAETYALSSDQNRYVVTFDGGGTFKLTAEQFSVEGPRLKTPVRAEEAEIGLRGPVANTFVSATLGARNLVFPDSDQSPFGNTVEAIQTTIELIGHPPRSGSTVERLDKWREDGGTIEVRRLSVQHGVLGMDGDGTLALDPALQPVGAFTAQITGFNPAVDGLVKLGLVKDQEGRLAKAALGLFAKAPPGGGPKQIEVPLTLQNRRLSVGPFPLIRIPPVRWD